MALNLTGCIFGAWKVKVFQVLTIPLIWNRKLLIVCKQCVLEQQELNTVGCGLRTMKCFKIKSFKDK